MASKLDEQFRWARHVDLLSLKLAKAAIKRHSRLIIQMPPQHGKSTTTSHWFPVWFFDHFSDRRIILCSYGADFAMSWGRKVRNTIIEHSDKLRVKMSPDSSAADSWELTTGGGMVTAGVGGSVTGRGADLLIVDDPYKNFEEATSRLVRDKIWDWWTSVALTRMRPDGSIAIVMTRWHEDDIVGRIMKEDQRRWETIKLPAIAGTNDPLGRDEGEALWPEQYSEQWLEDQRVAVGEYVWKSLYQQMPPSMLGDNVYYNFDEFRNIGDDENPVELVSGLPLHIAVDFNRDPGQYAIIGQYFPMERLATAVYEIHKPRMHVKQMVKEIDYLVQSMGGWDQWPEVHLFGDATGRTSQISDGATYWDLLMNELRKYKVRFKLRVPRHNPGVIDRVNTVNNALLTADGLTAYRINPRCKGLIRDFKELKTGDDIIDKSNREISHPSDADGYRISYLMPLKKITQRTSAVSVV